MMNERVRDVKEVRPIFWDGIKPGKPNAISQGANLKNKLEMRAGSSQRGEFQGLEHEVI